MKKFFLILILICLEINYVHTQDFRNVFWGMSIEEVKNTENSSFLKTSDSSSLIYWITLNDLGNLSNIDCYLQYEFDVIKTDLGKHNKLVSACYVLNEKYETDKQYIKKYNQFKNFLIYKYGYPKENYGQLGRLLTVWYKKDNTQIMLYLNTSEYLYYKKMALIFYCPNYVPSWKK